MLICGASLDIVYKTKSFLASNFDMKDIGEENVLLGIEVIRNNNVITRTLGREILKKLDIILVSTLYHDANT